MKISVIIPTRRRPARLGQSLTSLLTTRASAELEFMLGVDDDDGETIEWARSGRIREVRTFVGPRLGYANLHVYVNTLAANATGDWLLLWNDDSLMTTPGWDGIVASYEHQMVVLNPGTNHENHAKNQCIFPIFPRVIAETLGHVSLSNHYDTYVEWIANFLGIRRDVAIQVLHDRPDLTGAADDEVYAERCNTTGDFFSAENVALIEEDARRLIVAFPCLRQESSPELGRVTDLLGGSTGTGDKQEIGREPRL